MDSNVVQIDEVWLPGRWTERLADLYRDPAEFLCAAIRQADEADIGDLEEFGQALASQSHGDEVNETKHQSPQTVEGVEFETNDSYGDPVPDVTSALEESSNNLESRRWGCWPAITPPIWGQVLDVASRIQLIAKAAHNAGARLRWFDFDMANRYGRASGGTRIFVQ